ncbi:hypothetical protein [Legionella fallonii]|uniref:Substrate of the Dot/Icm secretion sytem n=1 Tax=Legionella fallonii LLAP-10 TaxID=1212491 RepID=A0A098G7B3_9GAMM|nr:hypothetical protein [Legionella fallonii]CEG57891.1 substrate of the Dot/Icm secretion sytem [Legionella fallonii LLAP-10]
MAVQLDLSHEFDSLVKKLKLDPDNPVLKMEIVKRIPEMKVLAKLNPLAQYRLAQAYSPGSDEYNEMMAESAEKGCTNAMLTICQDKLNSTSRTTGDLKIVAHYIAMIERLATREQSKDSYILKQSRALLESHPEVAALMKGEFKANSYNSGIRFFQPQPENNRSSQPDLDNGSTLEPDLDNSPTF